MHDQTIERARQAIADAGGLLTPRELADEWNVTEQAISERIRRGDFPEPVKVAGRVRLYLRGEVELHFARAGLRRYRTELLHKREQYRRIIAEVIGEGEDASSIERDLERIEYAISQMPDV